jgi:hypothetical protein
MATHVNPDPTLSPARIPIDGMPVVPPEDPPKPMPKLPPEDLPKLPPEDLIPLPCPTPSPAFYLPPGPIPYLPKPFHPDGSEEAGLPLEYLLTQSCSGDLKIQGGSITAKIKDKQVDIEVKGPTAEGKVSIKKNSPNPNDHPNDHPTHNYSPKQKLSSSPESHTGGGLVAETESPLSPVSEPVIMLVDSRGASAIPNSVTMASPEVAPVISGDNESVFVFSEVASESAPDAFEIGDLLIEGLQAFLA